MMKKLLPLPLGIGFVAGLWLYGFLSFVGAIENLQEPSVTSAEKSDAIVVLTGGSERIIKGVDLLEAGMGKKLFVSGVHKKLTLDALLGTQPVAPDLRSCCIIMGYAAGSTVGNAEETREWMDIEGYHSLRLVTANYHMPRALLLFHDAMPDIEIVPHPIAPDSVKLYEWWQHPGTVELLATEYTKYLVAHAEIWISK